DLVLRDRDDDRSAPADLAGKGSAARIRRARAAPRRLRRLLPGVGAAGLDAVDREDLARDLLAAGDPALDPRRDGCRLGRRLAAARHRRRVHPARSLDLLARRDVCEAAREAEEVGMTPGLRAVETERDIAAFLDVRVRVDPEFPITRANFDDGRERPD